VAFGDGGEVLLTFAGAVCAKVAVEILKNNTRIFIVIDLCVNCLLPGHFKRFIYGGFIKC
jgi:hypothetical protein